MGPGRLSQTDGLDHAALQQQHHELASQSDSNMNAGILLLLNRVWRVRDADTDRQWIKRSVAYVQHYKDVGAIAQGYVNPLKAEYIALMVECIRQKDLGAITVVELLNHIRGQRYPWLPSSDDDSVLLHVLSFILKLWLFTTTELLETEVTLQQAAHDVYLTAFEGEKSDDLIRLSDDFSAKSLERRGGFTIYWTSELAEHLTCAGKKGINVFRHGSVLQNYLEREDEVEKSMYPPHLLAEVDRTFYLLFPYEGLKASRRVFRESKTRKVDLAEFWADDAIGEFERLQLDTYPWFRNRLAEIQRRYNAAKPMRPKQWWYDRRKRTEWAALMITVLVLLLTIITTVTSILQVYAAFKLQS